MSGIWLYVSYFLANKNNTTVNPLECIMNQFPHMVCFDFPDVKEV